MFYERASEKVHIYNIEITKFIDNVLPDLKSKPYDPKTPRLHYWLWALCESQVNDISLTEVIQMSTTLQDFLKADSGFEQFTERYEYVSNDLAVRRQLAAWTAEMNKLDIMRTKGRLEKLVMLINKKKLKGKSREQIIDELELDISEVEILDNFEEYIYLI